MNAEEIEYVRRDEKQRFYFPLVPRVIESLVQPLHMVGRCECRHRLEPQYRLSIGLPFDDVVVRTLPLPATTSVLIKIAVELQHDARLERDFRVIGVDRVQHVTIACDLLF